MDDLLLKLAYNILAILVPALVALGVELIRRKLGVEMIKKITQELQAKQDWALLAVRFVEQSFKDLHGQEKYNQAAIWLSARAQENGLAISDSEVKGLIEAALRLIKDELGEDWANALDESETDDEEAG